MFDHPLDLAFPALGDQIRRDLVARRADRQLWVSAVAQPPPMSISERSL